VDFDVAQRVDLGSNVAVFRDDQHPLYRGTQYVMGAESHGRSCLAYCRDPDGAVERAQRSGNRPAARYPVKASLKQLQQKAPTD
jgi:hypothetical protein